MNAQTLLRTLGCIALVSASAVTASPQTEKKTDKKILPPPSTQQRVQYQPLNVKTGLWKTTVSYKRAGNLPISAEMLNNLTPEQRARLEARMSAAPANARTETQQHCFTKEELEHPIDFSDKNCTWSIDESTSTHASGSVTCNNAGVALQGTGSFDAPDQEHIQGSEHLTAASEAGPMSFDGTFTSTWQAASCGNVR